MGRASHSHVLLLGVLGRPSVSKAYFGYLCFCYLRTFLPWGDTLTAIKLKKTDISSTGFVGRKYGRSDGWNERGVVEILHRGVLGIKDAVLDRELVSISSAGWLDGGNASSRSSGA